MKWIIGVGGSTMDDVMVYRFTGTVQEAKEKLVEMVRKDRDRVTKGGYDEWDFGTESVNDVQLFNNRKLYAYGCYRDSHTDYTATLVGNIDEI